MRILLVEDAEDIAEAIARRLTKRGDAVDHVGTVEEAHSHISVQDYDLAILDIGLPDGSGADILRSLRARKKPTAVMMLTARGDIDDRVSALDSGADDYLVKPFDLRELEARIRALARRGGEDRAGVIECGDLLFDPAQFRVEVAGKPVALTRRELSLLEILLINRGRVISKEHLLESMFAFEQNDVGVNAVQLYIARLRRKIEQSGVEIRTLRGLGYQIVAPR